MIHPIAQEWLDGLRTDVQFAVATGRWKDVTYTFVQTGVDEPGSQSLCSSLRSRCKDGCVLCWLEDNQREFNRAAWKVLQRYPKVIAPMRRVLERDVKFKWSKTRRDELVTKFKYSEQEADEWVRDYGYITSRAHARGLLDHFLVSRPDWT
jgi:hypothetical protein